VFLLSYVVTLVCSTEVKALVPLLVTVAVGWTVWPKVGAAGTSLMVQLASRALVVAAGVVWGVVSSTATQAWVLLEAVVQLSAWLAIR